MLELNAWFFVLLLNFLVLLYVLNLILFKPLLRLFRERDDSIRGSLSAAREMEAKREEAFSSMNRELQGARQKAKEVFENARREGLKRQKEIMEDANRQSSGLISQARAGLHEEAERARSQIRKDAERFSDDIVRKLVGA